MTTGQAYRTRSGRAHGWLPFGLCVIGCLWLWSGPDSLPGQTIDEATLERDRATAASSAPASLIVDFRDDLDDEDLARNAWEEEPISAYSRRDRLYRLRFGDPQARDRALAALRTDPTVEAVDYDLDVHLPPDAWTASGRPAAPDCEGAARAARRGFPDDPCFRYQWHLTQAGVPTAWPHARGRGVVVAVIDTGVSRVPDLAGAELTAGYNFVADHADAADDHGHGTHVAGTIAQSTNNGRGVAGVAFEASIMPLKVLSARGSGSMAAIAQAIRWAADHGAHVINLSLGGPFPVETIRRAIGYARDRGVVVVAAAGNDGRGKVGYPARYPGVLAVAATQFDERTTFYSNWGPQIDLAAPGGNIRVDQNGDGLPDGVLQNTVVPGDPARTGYLLFMGTSMASPHVAGAAALLVGAGVTRPERVEHLLLHTARAPRSPPGTPPSRARRDAERPRLDDHYGAGLVDAGAAVVRARRARDGGALALGASLCLGLLTGSVRRRPRRALLALGLALGACGPLGPLAWLGLPLPAGLDLFAVGLPLAASRLGGPAWAGSPMLLSALLPIAALAVGYGVRATRSLLAGFALGTAALLFSLAIANTVDVAWVPDVLDRAWLALHAALCALLGALALRED